MGFQTSLKAGNKTTQLLKRMEISLPIPKEC